jgi:uncharacterized flavoprotein (TIGR03862 family)
MQTHADTSIAIIGGGPAGLAAAEVIAAAGYRVTVFDAMPTIGRKFLLAGKSGLNLTHGEDYALFATRYGAANTHLKPALDAFTPDDVRQWADGLGVETFVGTSGRVFPRAMKASPLLRAWRQRLENLGVTIKTRWRWIGFGDGLTFETPDGIQTVKCDASLLALGGASWPRLGSDARWVSLLEEEGVAVRPFRPANCGFDVAWSASFVERFAGAPVKSVTATSSAGRSQGEFVISRHGIEGSLVYAHASALRDALDAGLPAALVLDLVPGRPMEALAAALEAVPRKTSFSNRLRKAARLDDVKLALVREIAREADRLTAGELAALLKALPVPVTATRPIAEAISSAGGISLGAVDASGMLKAKPGCFVAGEMLDWEAPTGGYLLTACLANGRATAFGLVTWLQSARSTVA